MKEGYRLAQDVFGAFKIYIGPPKRYLIFKAGAP
jgi:hypothetical protein